MKKKHWLIIGGILILTVIVAVIWFIQANTGKTERGETIQLRGTWRVYQYAEYSVENEFMVFQNGFAADYRDGNDVPHMKSAYSLKDSRLSLTDIGKEYAVRIVSDNNIILVEPDTREWKLIRVADGDRNVRALTPQDLAGEYEVLRVAGEPRVNEVMIFTDEVLKDTREGKEFLSCTYILNGGHLLQLPDINKTFTVYKNGELLLFIDNAERYIWELRQK